MLSSRQRDALALFYHKCRDRLGLQLHRFVKLEAEEETRFRRRMHLHICLLCVSGGLSFASVVSLVSVTYVTGATTFILIIQETIDYIGRF